MTNKAKAVGVGAPTALSESLILNQPTFTNNDYKSFSEFEGKEFKDSCSFCRNELTDDSIIHKSIATCPNCLLKWLTFSINQRDYAGRKRTPKIFKMHRCFACLNNFTAQKMSSCLLFCTTCRLELKQKDQKAKEQLLNKSLQQIADYLRRRL